MAEIRDRLVLDAGGYLNKLDAVALRATATGRMVQTAARQAQGGISAATQEIVDRLGVFQDAIARSYTEAQHTDSINALERAMRRCGLVATSAAAEEHMAAMLTRSSLQEMAEAGDIAANAVAEAHYQEAAAIAEARRVEAAAAAAERENARQEKIARQAATAAIRAEEKALRQAAAAAEREAKVEREEAAATQQASAAHRNIFSRIAQHTAELIRNAGAAARARQAHSALGNKLLRMGMLLFTAKRMFRFLSDSIKRMPDGIQTSWTKMTSGIRDTLVRGFASMMKGMQPAIDRFNAFMNSRSGQRLARGLETGMEAIGRAVGWLLDKITALGQWMGDHFSVIAAAAAAALLLYAGNMLVAAAATAAVNWPILLMIGLAAALMAGLQKAGFTAQDVFTGIGKSAGWLYAFTYNLVADTYNVIAAFAEFFANVFNDPLAAVWQLFSSVFGTIMSIVESAAKAIDALLGTNMAGAVSGFTAWMQNGIDYLFGENKITVDRMEKIGYGDTMEAWGRRANAFGQSLSSFSLDNKTAQYIKSIDSNTASISKNLSDEDMKYVEEIATRNYDRRTNLTLSPVITVKVSGGSSAKQTGEDIGRAIADILARQAASSTALNYQEAQ